MHSSNPNFVNNHIGMIFFALVVAVLFISEGISKPEFPVENTELSISNLEEFVNIINDDTKNTYSEKNPSNKIININELNENVVICSFTTTWCPHCPSVLISLDRLQKILKENGITNVKILSFNVGDETLTELRSHARKNGLRKIFDNLFFKSVSSNVMPTLSLNGVPVCIIFGTEGEFLGCHVGGANYASDEFVKYIKKVSGHDGNENNNENFENNPVVNRG